uniref:Uncharacterized protein n=1 Tax=Physcomitrium patens TaxID=3218 RepID=A0A2K1LBV7_PHYPA|nr:hypothetical protein PHYPA_001935 [Physcomitrium patens]
MCLWTAQDECQEKIRKLDYALILIVIIFVHVIVVPIAIARRLWSSSCLRSFRLFGGRSGARSRLLNVVVFICLLFNNLNMISTSRAVPPAMMLCRSFSTC